MATPGFQTWTIVFLLASFQAGVLAILLTFVKKGNIGANRLLSVVLVLFCLTLVHYVSFWTGYMKIYPHFMALSNSFAFVYGPLLFFYFKRLYHQPSTLKDLLHFVPFGFHVILLCPFYFLSAQEKLMIMEEGMGVQWAIIPWLQIIHMAFYACLIQKVYHSTKDFIAWRRTLLFSFLGFISSYLAYYLLILHPDFSLAWDYMISGSMTICIFIIAMMGFIQPEIFSGKRMLEIISPVKYAHSSLTPQVARVLLNRLDQVIHEEEAYRNPELSLDFLASKMNISKHILSQLINEYKEKSFSDYINEIRIISILEKFRQIKNTKTPAIHLAYEAGFNNKVSFYQHFKKYTGTTPGKYRKKVNDYQN